MSRASLPVVLPVVLPASHSMRAALSTEPHQLSQPPRRTRTVRQPENIVSRCASDDEQSPLGPSFHKSEKREAVYTDTHGLWRGHSRPRKLMSYDLSS